ncbi:MAG: ribonuclease HI family protein [Acidobacteria bacterium]|nr:ribonuclease HI family protein [Acidobacteriota bacterium]
MPSPSLSSSSPELIAYIDGGSRGNPGPAGFGVVIQDAKGHTLDTIAEFLGGATNNVAEYRALLAALEYATEKKCQRLKVYCDSELIARQMQGRYRVQSPDLKPLYQRAQDLVHLLDRFAIEHIPRERNQQADRLANEAMDQGGAAPTERTLAFLAVFEKGKLQPLATAPELEEGAEYEIRARKRIPK